MGQLWAPCEFLDSIFLQKLYICHSGRSFSMFYVAFMHVYFIHRALVSRALLENSELINWCLLFKAVSGLIAHICGNGYIVGINQIYDIGIDK